MAMMLARGARPGGRRAGGIPAAALLAAAALGPFIAAMTALGIDRAATESAGTANLHALRPFWLTFALSWAALTLLWRRLAAAERHAGGAAGASGGAARSEPGAGRPRIAVNLLILVVAAAARLAVVLGHDLALSDDVHRYVFDGRNLAGGLNPYLRCPRDCALDTDEPWPGENDAAARVNHPAMHTVYLPASQAAFGGLALAERGLPRALQGERWFRLAFAAADLALVALILSALTATGRSTWWAALYAWHPLPIAEIAGSGHQDVMGIALLLGAIVLWWRGRGGVAGVAAAGALAALATLVKPIALPIALLMARGRTRDLLMAAPVAIVVMLAVAGPFLLLGDGEALRNLAGSLKRFTLQWAHFGGIYEVLLGILEHLAPEWGSHRREQLARAVCGAAVVAAFVLLWRRPAAATMPQFLRRAQVLILLMLLLSSTAHPWYLLWGLALLPASPSAAVWIASLTLPWGYAVLGDVARWTTPAWVVAAAYVPVYAALAREFVLHCRAARRAGTRGEPAG
jgi:hypothetical protein